MKSKRPGCYGEREGGERGGKERKRVGWGRERERERQKDNKKREKEGERRKREKLVIV